MTLSLADVRHVAELARLELTPEEERRYLTQLSAILSAAEALNELDTAEVQPTRHATFGQSALREDRVEPSLPTEKGLLNAPAKVGTSFAVPKVLE